MLFNQPWNGALIIYLIFNFTFSQNSECLQLYNWIGQSWAGDCCINPPKDIISCINGAPGVINVNSNSPNVPSFSQLSSLTLTYSGSQMLDLRGISTLQSCNVRNVGTACLPTGTTTSNFFPSVCSVIGFRTCVDPNPAPEIPPVNPAPQPPSEAPTSIQSSNSAFVTSTSISADVSTTTSISTTISSFITVKNFTTVTDMKNNEMVSSTCNTACTTNESKLSVETSSSTVLSPQSAVFIVIISISLILIGLITVIYFKRKQKYSKAKTQKEIQNFTETNNIDNLTVDDYHEKIPYFFPGDSLSESPNIYEKKTSMFDFEPEIVQEDLNFVDNVEIPPNYNDLRKEIKTKEEALEEAAKKGAISKETLEELKKQL